ncbi:MAG TPA: tRNA pseudouridine(55) synthase TruB [Methylophilaceae bacterium]|nr:tRNA pseudouridine(55) synthase TruB [Methylophilaceae bacterium]
MQFKRAKRKIHGVLLLDKPLGYSSNQALQKVKWLFQAEKAGHTGTLDPLATGLLPICFGEATKFVQYVTDADKTYIANIKLGVKTTTGDAEGEVISKQPVNVSRQQFEQTCQQFIGTISQIPPMHSALKHEGKALYKYAREGLEIERKARQVTIQHITVISLNGSDAVINVRCSKGTYIRTLAEDIGSALGCGAHLRALRRTETAGYSIQNTLNINQLEEMSLEMRDQQLLPLDSAIARLPMVMISIDAAYYFRQGQAIWEPGHVPDGSLRIYEEDGAFIGLGIRLEDGKIAPKRLVNL